MAVAAAAAASSTSPPASTSPQMAVAASSPTSPPASPLPPHKLHHPMPPIPLPSAQKTSSFRSPSHNSLSLSPSLISPSAMLYLSSSLLQPPPSGTPVPSSTSPIPSDDLARSPPRSGTSPSPLLPSTSSSSSSPSPSPSHMSQALGWAEISLPTFPQAAQMSTSLTQDGSTSQTSASTSSGSASPPQALSSSMTLNCPSLATSPIASLVTSPTASPWRKLKSPSSPKGRCSPSASKEGGQTQSNFTFAMPELSLDDCCSGAMPGRLSHADELFRNGKLLPLAPSAARSIRVYEELPVLEKVDVHEPHVCAAALSRLLAQNPLSSTSQICPPKVFRIEEKEVAFSSQHKDSSVLHNSFNVFYHIEKPSFSHEISPLSMDNPSTYGSTNVTTPPLRHTLSTTLHNYSSQQRNVDASPSLTKKLSCMPNYGNSNTKDAMYSQPASIVKHEQLTLKEVLSHPYPRKVESSSFLKKLRIKFCAMVGARSRKVKVRKQPNLKIQLGSKINDHNNLRGQQGSSSITNKNANREGFKPSSTQRKAMRKVHNVSSPAHAFHYINQRAEAERLKKKTFLPYHSHLFSCLGSSF